MLDQKRVRNNTCYEQKKRQQIKVNSEAILPKRITHSVVWVSHSGVASGMLPTFRLHYFSFKHR